MTELQEKPTVRLSNERVFFVNAVETDKHLRKKHLVVSDVDMTWFDRDRNETSAAVRSQVAILNSLLDELKAAGDDTEIVPLTARPADAFLNKNSPLSFYLGGTIKRDDGTGSTEEIVCQSIEGLEVIGCELGSVMLVKDLPENGASNSGWSVRIHSEYVEYATTTREKLKKVLQYLFVTTNKYKFEQGTFVLLSLQRQDDQHMSAEEKSGILQELENELKKRGMENLWNDVEVDMEGHDLDLNPKKLMHESKAVGLKEIMRILKERGREYKMDEVIMIDDSFKPVAEAFPLVAKGGGRIASPANRSMKLTPIMNEFGGLTSDYPIFWGTISALREILLNEKLKVPWLEEFKRFREYSSDNPALVFLGSGSVALINSTIAHAREHNSGFGLSAPINESRFLMLGDRLNDSTEFLEVIRNNPEQYLGMSLVFSINSTEELKNAQKILSELAKIYLGYEFPNISVQMFSRENSLNESVNTYTLAALPSSFFSLVDRKQIEHLVLNNNHSENFLWTSYQTKHPFDEVDKSLVVSDIIHKLLSVFQNRIQANLLARKK